ncbi:MAG: phage major capsid protein [Rickettsiaceae bacterium]|nr:phage major capsid protein [Rickettsiaceae bacterium]
MTHNDTNIKDNMLNEYFEVNKKMNNLERALGELQVNLHRPESMYDENYNDYGLSDYIRKGKFDQIETKALSSLQEEGGGAIFPSINKKIVEILSEHSVIRKLASVQNISSNSLEILVQKDEFTSGWVQEKAEDIKETDSAKLERKIILAHELYAQPKASQRLLDDAAVNIDSWIATQISNSFISLENHSFLHGNGEIMPKGFLTYNQEKIKHVKVEEEKNIQIDDLLKLINSLSEKYLANATFLMHRNTLSKIQNLRDNNGRFIWNPSEKGPQFDRLFGIPLMCCDQMPKLDDENSGKYVVLADFKAAYTIVDRQDVRLMRDPYTEKPFVKFYSTKRVGGDMVNFKAMSILAA